MHDFQRSRKSWRLRKRLNVFWTHRRWGLKIIKLNTFRLLSSLKNNIHRIMFGLFRVLIVPHLKKKVFVVSDTWKVLNNWMTQSCPMGLSKEEEKSICFIWHRLTDLNQVLGSKRTKYAPFCLLVYYWRLIESPPGPSLVNSLGVARSVQQTPP